MMSSCGNRLTRAFSLHGGLNPPLKRDPQTVQMKMRLGTTEKWIPPFASDKIPRAYSLVLNSLFSPRVFPIFDDPTRCHKKKESIRAQITLPHCIVLYSHCTVMYDRTIPMKVGVLCCPNDLGMLGGVPKSHRAEVPSLPRTCRSPAGPVQWQVLQMRRPCRAGSQVSTPRSRTCSRVYRGGPSFLNPVMSSSVFVLWVSPARVPGHSTCRLFLHLEDGVFRCITYDYHREHASVSLICNTMLVLSAPESQ